VAASDGNLRIIPPVRLGERIIAESLIDKCDQGKLPNSRHLGQVTFRSSRKTAFSETTGRSCR
jgi:hypothetical protein